MLLVIKEVTIRNRHRNGRRVFDLERQGLFLFHAANAIAGSHVKQDSPDAGRRDALVIFFNHGVFANQTHWSKLEVMQNLDSVLFQRSLEAFRTSLATSKHPNRLSTFI